jgi:heme-degrading monooxygenase HmoA
MPTIVVTRLRLRDLKTFDEFFTAAVAVVDQAKSSKGNLDATVLADANSVFWTATAWRDATSMSAFVESEPHLSTMAHIDEWCDEATFVNWQQDVDDLPDWRTGFTRIVTEGQVAALSNPSEAHATRAFPAPVEAT